MAVSDAQYASFVDRVAACREAEDRAKEDTKRVYAEIADAGEDKTEIGLIVRELRMSEKDRIKANLREEAAENGRIRYRRGKASHVRAREDGVSSATPKASISEAFDPETGELSTTPQTQPSPHAASDLTVIPAPAVESRQVTHSEPQPETAAQVERLAVPAPTSLEESDITEISSPIAGSSNGRTTAFDAANVGSTPAPAPTLSFADRIKTLRPLCQRPEACRSSGGREHCYLCRPANSQPGAA